VEELLGIQRMDLLHIGHKKLLLLHRKIPGLIQEDKVLRNHQENQAQVHSNSFVFQIFERP
jgi:hypothetical protein